MEMTVDTTTTDTETEAMKKETSKVKEIKKNKTRDDNKRLEITRRDCSNSYKIPI